MKRNGETVGLKIEEEKVAPVITLVAADDWQGLYIDGELGIEGHQLTAAEVLAALGIELLVKWVDEEWLERRGELPKKMKDVKFAEEE